MYIYIDTYKEQKTNTTKTAQNSDQHQLEQQGVRGKGHGHSKLNKEHVSNLTRT